MKIRFESADEMREKVPIGSAFRVYCTTLKTWSSEQCKYVLIEDKHPRRGLFENENTVFIFNHKSHKYGQRLPIEYFVMNFVVDYAPVDEAATWERRVKGVIKKLDASGLWPDIKQTFEELLEIGYERRRKLHDLFWDDSWGRFELRKDTRNNPERAAAYNKAFEDHYGTLMNEIPFAFLKGDTEDSLWYVNTDLIFEMSDAKPKSMYFGKWGNTRIKAEIQRAFDEKRRYSARARTSYDVSFEYDPEKNKAWYSEEYKNCGNGHYYLAIDANTALFYEDD